MTKTEIANIALRRARENRINGDVEASSTPNAELIRDLWAQTSQLVLKAIRPSFAQKQALLTQLTAAPKFEWDYAYQLPTDFIEVVRMNGLNYGEVEDAYDVLSDRRLVTDEGTVSLTYVFDETDYTRWDSEFIEAFALKMAYEIANENRGSQELISNLVTLYEKARSEASAGSANARKDPSIRERVIRGSSWTRGDRIISTNETND